MYKLLNIILLLSLTVNAQNIEDDPVNIATNLQAKFKIQECTEYALAEDAQENKNKMLHRRYTYNNDGNLISDITYTAGNSSDSTYMLYVYNGLVLETKKYSGQVNMESDVIEAATEYFEYNDLKQLSKKTVITTAGEKAIYSYSYNEKGQINTIEVDSAERKRYTYFYNDSGKVTHKLGETPKVNNPGWLLIDSFIYEYDANNNLVKELHIKENMERKRSLFEYNSRGQLMKKTVYVYGDTKPVYTIVYDYDAKTGLPKSRSVKWLPDKNKREYKNTNYSYIYTHRK